MSNGVLLHPAVL